MFLLHSAISGCDYGVFNRHTSFLTSRAIRVALLSAVYLRCSVHVDGSQMLTISRPSASSRLHPLSNTKYALREEKNRDQE